MDTLLVVPAFNEAQNLVHVLPRLLEQFRLDADVLIVDDGSQDGTSSVCLKYPVRVVRHPWNMGYSAALLTGYQYASEHGYHFVLQYDADGQHDPLDLLEVLKALQGGSEHLVIGSRYLGDSGFNPGSLKSFAICIFCGIIRIFTRRIVTDPTSGIRGVSHHIFRYYAKQNHFPSDYPDADFVMDVLLRGWGIKEVAVGHRDRMAGKSMHSGLKPVLYIVKVVVSMGITIFDHWLLGRGAAGE